MTFENFLGEKWQSINDGSNKKDPDVYDDWICYLDPDDWFRYAEEWGKLRPKVDVGKIADVLRKDLPWLREDLLVLAQAIANEIDRPKVEKP